MAVSAAFALRGVDENLFSIAAVASAVLGILFFFILAIASLLRCESSDWVVREELQHALEKADSRRK